MEIYNKFNYVLYLLILIDCGLLIVSAVYDVSFISLYFVSIFDLITCIFILIDFIYRCYHAKDKKEFFKHNWIDLIAAIPVDFFLLRALRFIKLFKLFKLVKIAKIFVILRKDIKSFFKFIKESYLDKIIILILVIVLFSTLFMYFTEPSQHTLIDSFWFVITSITTVGYGDIIPDTQQGKILTMLLVITGFLALSVFTGSISAAYSNKVIVKQEEGDLKEEIDNLNKKIDNLTEIIKELKDNQKIEGKIDKK